MGQVSLFSFKKLTEEGMGEVKLVGFYIIMLVKGCTFSKVFLNFLRQIMPNFFIFQPSILREQMMIRKLQLLLNF